MTKKSSSCWVKDKEGWSVRVKTDVDKTSNDDDSQPDVDTDDTAGDGDKSSVDTGVYIVAVFVIRNHFSYNFFI